jgi:hypothetical protein
MNPFYCNNNHLRTPEARLKVASLLLNKLHTKQLLNVFNLLKDDTHVQVKNEEQELNKKSFEWVLCKNECAKVGANYNRYKSRGLESH